MYFTIKKSCDINKAQITLSLNVHNIVQVINIRVASWRWQLAAETCGRGCCTDACVSFVHVFDFVIRNVFKRLSTVVKYFGTKFKASFTIYSDRFILILDFIHVEIS
jgi:hypothetical protein